MGTSLSGLTPATTFDALIKVGDNGPLSATAKVLSDGLGNDSALALATTAVGIGTTTPTSVLDVVSAGTGVAEFEGPANATVSFKGVGFVEGLIRCGGEFTIGSTNNFPISFLTNNSEKVRITSTGNVGIGTSAPVMPLDVIKNTGTSLVANIKYSSRFIEDSVNARGILLGYDSTTQVGVIGSDSGGSASSIAFYTYSGSVFGERARITTDGLTFNGDTAAANALDDYEEGTFTITAVPSTSGTITLSVDTCTYTKIGRQVTIKGQLLVGSVASPLGTQVTLGGLPFTSINSVAGRGSGSATFFPLVGSGSVVVNFQLQNVSEYRLVLDASTIVAGDEFYITLTYFV